ncbi:MAG: MerR family transcriptional regulator [Dehalococcoidia bacterium]|nr:MerR family transcriptional regulator [Dehalococcoidia bacterium]
MANNSGNISVEKQQSLRASTEVKKALEQVNSLSSKTSLKPSETPVHYTESSHSPQGELDGLYIISVAARILRMHPQTLRKYEKVGLVRPSRTIGMLRLYSEYDIQKLRLIKHLISEMKLNLAGVELALAVFDRLNNKLAHEKAPAQANSKDFEQAKKDIFEIVFGIK